LSPRYIQVNSESYYDPFIPKETACDVRVWEDVAWTWQQREYLHFP
jgi:hypothetical protein